MSVIDTSKISFWKTHPNCDVRVIGSGERITMLYSITHPGPENPGHKHPHEQMIYCLQGEGTYRVGDREVIVKKDYTLLIPPNVPHTLKKTGKEDYIAIEIFSPVRPDLIRGKFTPEKLKE
jgi:quercetin dioxygenase-like cupin family protein